jgi:hypothetical protein
VTREVHPSLLSTLAGGSLSAIRLPVMNDAPGGGSVVNIVLPLSVARSPPRLSPLDDQLVVVVVSDHDQVSHEVLLSALKSLAGSDRRPAVSRRRAGPAGLGR